MEKDNGINGKLLRFKYLRDFQTWAQSIGYDPDQCREPWEMLKAIYRPLYGEPVYREQQQGDRGVEFL